MNDGCVFCRIVAGDVPCTRVLDEDDILAFLDISPIVKGHTLVIPKPHYERLTDVPGPLLGRLFNAVQRIVAAQIGGVGADGVNLFQANGAAAGQVVPHVHVHVIPRFQDDGHRWNWTAHSYASPDEAAAMAARIRAAIGG